VAIFQRSALSHQRYTFQLCHPERNFVIGETP
jgi:hypothetical protein